MILIFAEMTDQVVQGISQAGVLGLVVVWFMARDKQERKRQQDREDARELAWSNREVKRDEEISKLRDAIYHLIQVTAAEVLSRPSILDRTRRDTEEIHEAAKAAKGLRQKQ